MSRRFYFRFVFFFPWMLGLVFVYMCVCVFIICKNAIILIEEEKH